MRFGVKSRFGGKKDRQKQLNAEAMHENVEIL